MGGFIIVDDRRDLRNEMHERMGNHRDVSGRHPETGRDYEEGYRRGYEHGYRDHENDMNNMSEHGDYRSTRYGR